MGRDGRTENRIRDRSLYQLGPDEFTAARNTLAKTAGPDAAAIKRLTKPPIAAWAVNQVYWQHRDVYDALVTAAKELRQTHKTILGRPNRRPAVRRQGSRSGGRPGIESRTLAARRKRAPGHRHHPPGHRDHAARPAFRRPAGTPQRHTAAGRIRNACGAVDRRRTGRAHAEESRGPGKGDRTSTRGAAGRTQSDAAPFHRKTTHTPAKPPDPKAAARAREAAARAARELREAEHTARREEFESARATRDAEKAARQLEQAREALAAAQREVEEAESRRGRSGAHESRRREARRSGRTSARGSKEEGGKVSSQLSDQLTRSRTD